MSLYPERIECVTACIALLSLFWVTRTSDRSRKLGKHGVRIEIETLTVVHRTFNLRDLAYYRTRDIRTIQSMGKLRIDIRVNVPRIES